MNIESIGGWNVWFLVFFFLLSQSVIVHHLREISKSLRSQQPDTPGEFEFRQGFD